MPLSNKSYIGSKLVTRVILGLFTIKSVSHAGNKSISRPAADSVDWNGYVYPTAFNPAKDNLVLTAFPAYTSAPALVAGDGKFTVTIPVLPEANGYQVDVSSATYDYLPGELTDSKVTIISPNGTAKSVNIRPYSEIPNITANVSIPRRNYAAFGPAATVTPVAVATAPGPVRNLTATATEGEVALQWDAPTNNGSSAITGYCVEGRNGSTGAFNSIVASQTGLTYNDTGLPNGSARTYRVKALNAVGAGAAVVSAEVTPVAVVKTYQQKVSERPNLLGYWNEVQGSNVPDKSGNNRNGVTSGPGVSASTEGPRGRGMAFNGENLIELPSMITGTTARTIIVWVKALGSAQIISSPALVSLGNNHEDNGLGFQFGFRMTSGGNIQTAVRGGYKRANEIVSDGTWKQVVVTMPENGRTGSLKHYVNGQIGTVMATADQSIDTRDNPLSGRTGDLPTVIGGAIKAFDNTRDSRIVGILAEVQIYNRELTAAQILQDYNEALA